MREAKSLGLQEKKKRRFRLSTVTLCKIRTFQKTIGYLIHNCPLWNGYGKLHNSKEVACTSRPLPSLVFKEVADAYVMDLLEDANLCSVHRKWVMVICILFSFGINLNITYSTKCLASDSLDMQCPKITVYFSPSSNPFVMF